VAFAEAPHPRGPLDLDALATRLEAHGWSGPVPRYVAETGSTNADLVALVRDSAGGSTSEVPDGLVLVTDRQYAGRGRLDRRWEVPAFAGLTWSFVLRTPGMTNGPWGWVPLVVGLGVLDGLREVCRDAGSAVAGGLKWPNDLVIPGAARDGTVGPRKLGGILAERVPVGSEQRPAVVVGVGLNVDQQAEELPTGSATSLRLEGIVIRREEVLAAALSSVSRRLRQWQDEGFSVASVRQEYSAACVSLGAELRVVRHAQPDLVGVGRAVDAEGRLIVAGPDGDQPVSAGDVVHLR